MLGPSGQRARNWLAITPLGYRLPLKTTFLWVDYPTGSIKSEAGEQNHFIRRKAQFLCASQRLIRVLQPHHKISHFVAGNSSHSARRTA